MKLSLKWLQQYCDYGLTTDELCYKMTMAGLEVENIETIGNDTIFEIEITPNRPDALSILGLSREVSAIVDKPLILPEIKEYEDSGNVDIVVEDKGACGRYIGTLIENIKVGTLSADKMKLLASLGHKPISNIVDITNFVLFEQGQPLHAFDYDKLEGGKIIVRFAKKGEKIIALDDVEYTLDETILVIADAKKPVAIAGIMGGKETAVTASTKNILLESACFDLGVVRRGSRKLGLASDSSYRFERGVAYKGIESGSNRATDLICELAGGTVGGRKDVVVQEPELICCEITVTGEDIQNLLGTPLDLDRAKKILCRLGCVVVLSDKSLSVIPPAYRRDLKIKEDIIEEIGRVVGFDNLPMSLPSVPAKNIPVDVEKMTFEKRLAQGLVAQGLNEIVTHSLVSQETAGEKGISLENWMSQEHAFLRTDLLVSMLKVISLNMNQGQKDLQLFEIGKRYFSDGERQTLAVGLMGVGFSDWRKPKPKKLDFFDLKGVLENALAHVGIDNISLKVATGPLMQKGSAADIFVNEKNVGVLYQVAKNILLENAIKKADVFFAQIDIDLLKDIISPRSKYQSTPDFPAMVRDLSLGVKDASLDELKSVCVENGGELLKKIDFVELYTGDKIEPGVKGYVLSLTYQSYDRTLVDEEVTTLHETIAEKLIEKFKVIRR